MYFAGMRHVNGVGPSVWRAKSRVIPVIVVATLITGLLAGGVVEFEQGGEEMPSEESLLALPQNLDEWKFMECLRHVEKLDRRSSTAQERAFALASYRESRPSNFYAGRAPIDNDTHKSREIAAALDRDFRRKYGCSLQ